MSKFMKGIKGVEKKHATPEEIDDIAEKLHAKLDRVEEVKSTQIPVIQEVSIPTSKPKPIIEETPEEAKEDLHRLTLDIPKELFEQMKKDTKRKGQTIKGFIVSLIYDFYEK